MCFQKPLASTRGGGWGGILILVKLSSYKSHDLPYILTTDVMMWVSNIDICMIPFKSLWIWLRAPSSRFYGSWLCLHFILTKMVLWINTIVWFCTTHWTVAHSNGLDLQNTVLDSLSMINSTTVDLYTLFGGNLHNTLNQRLIK